MSLIYQIDVTESCGRSGCTSVLRVEPRGHRTLRLLVRLSMGFIAYFGLALTLMRGQTDTASNAAPSALEQFKQFICSPPVINNIVFQKKVPMGGGMRPLDGSFARSTSFEYFQAKWQTNGFLFRQLSSPTDTTNLTVAGHLISWSGHQHALWEPDWFFTTWDDRDPSVAGKELSVFYTSQFFLSPLRELLNLGILYADIGTVRWKGNHFRAECDVDHEHLRITGDVMAVRELPPDQMTVRYEFPHVTYNHVLRYSYPLSSKCRFIPIVITDFWVSGTSSEFRQGIQVNEWRILTLETAGAPLPREAFDPAPFARENLWPTRLYTNSGLYVRATNGALRLTALLGRQTQPGVTPRKAALAALYAGWGGLNIAILALIMRAKERQTNETETKD